MVPPHVLCVFNPVKSLCLWFYSFHRLQTEKEALYNDSRSVNISSSNNTADTTDATDTNYASYVPDQISMSFLLYRTKIEELNQRKEEEMKAMNTRIQKLQSDVMAANQVRPLRVNIHLLIRH